MKRDNAVSPVIGILLMIVVTIIIAAIVSAFAGGMAGDANKAVQATLAPEVVIQDISDTIITNSIPNYPSTSYVAKNGILFTHMGGDPFELDNIKIQLENQGISMVVSTDDTIPNTDYTCLGDSYKGKNLYLEKLNNASSANEDLINPGDSFMLWADSCYNTKGQKYISWRYGTGTGYGVIDGFYEYSVVDKVSNSPITSGSFYLQ